MSGYLGSIGFGFPAAMGAWAADPDRPIVAVTGDGGFGQYLAELTTAVKYDMNITHVLLNNSSLGKITQGAARRAVRGVADRLHNPDFAEYARLCGATGIAVDRPDALDDALHDAWRTTARRWSRWSLIRSWCDALGSVRRPPLIGSPDAVRRQPSGTPAPRAVRRSRTPRRCRA